MASVRGYREEARPKPGPRPDPTPLDSTRLDVVYSNAVARLGPA